MADYLDSAKQALADGVEVGMNGGTQLEYLLHVADTHARIAAAETLRAILGALVPVPIEDEPEGIR